MISANQRTQGNKERKGISLERMPRDSFAGVLQESVLGVLKRKLDLHVGFKNELVCTEIFHYLNVTLHVPVLMSHILRVLSYDPLTTFSSSTCKSIIDQIIDLAITQVYIFSTNIAHFSNIFHKCNSFKNIFHKYRKFSNFLFTVTIPKYLSTDKSLRGGGGSNFAI